MVLRAAVASALEGDGVGRLVAASAACPSSCGQMGDTSSGVEGPAAALTSISRGRLVSMGAGGSTGVAAAPEGLGLSLLLARA